MDDYASRKVSVSVRNALSVNSHQNNELVKRVKSLEAERDMHLLNLQIKRDEVFYASPSARRKMLAKSPSASESLNTSVPVSQQETLDLKTGWHKDEEVTKLQKAHNLPPLHLDRAGVIATPPRLRKTRNIHSATSPNFASSSPADSPKLGKKLLTRQSSSPQMLSNSNSTANANDIRREENGESKQYLSPRLLRSNVEDPPVHSPTSSSGGLVFKFDLASNHAQMSRRPATAASSRDSNAGSEVHRGLLLLPVSSSKEQTKSKEAKKINVFNRLYSGSKKREGKRTHLDDLATRHIPSPSGSPKLASTRRRSLSLSDLSEICDKLKTCRYLRDNTKLS